MRGEPGDQRVRRRSAAGDRSGGRRHRRLGRRILVGLAELADLGPLQRAHGGRGGGDRIGRLDLAREVEQRAGGGVRLVRGGRLADRAEQRGERGRIGLGGGREPARGGAGVVVVGGEHAARRLQRGAQLGIADRLGQLLERHAELVGAAVEERELELGEQRADVGRRLVEDLARGDPGEVLLVARHHQVDAVVAERPALERPRDRDLGVEVADRLAEVAAGPRQPAQPAQRRGRPRIGHQRGVVVAARPLVVGEPLAQPPGLDAQRRRRRAVVDGRDLALVDQHRLREGLVERGGRQRLDLLRPVPRERGEIEGRLDRRRRVRIDRDRRGQPGRPRRLRGQRRRRGGLGRGLRPDPELEDRAVHRRRGRGGGRAADGWHRSRRLDPRVQIGDRRRAQRAAALGDLADREPAHGLAGRHRPGLAQRRRRGLRDAALAQRRDRRRERRQRTRRLERRLVELIGVVELVRIAEWIGADLVGIDLRGELVAGERRRLERRLVELIGIVELVRITEPIGFVELVAVVELLGIVELVGIGELARICELIGAVELVGVELFGGLEPARLFERRLVEWMGLAELAGVLAAQPGERVVERGARLRVVGDLGDRAAIKAPAPPHRRHLRQREVIVGGADRGGDVGEVVLGARPRRRPHRRDVVVEIELDHRALSRRWPVRGIGAAHDVRHAAAGRVRLERRDLRRPGLVVADLDVGVVVVAVGGVGFARREQALLELGEVGDPRLLREHRVAVALGGVVARVERRRRGRRRPAAHDRRPAARSGARRRRDLVVVERVVRRRRARARRRGEHAVVLVAADRVGRCGGERGLRDLVRQLGAAIVGLVDHGDRRRALEIEARQIVVGAVVGGRERNLVRRRARRLIDRGGLGRCRWGALCERRLGAGLRTAVQGVERLDPGVELGQIVVAQERSGAGLSRWLGGAHRPPFRPMPRRSRNRR
ncbi:MAG: hypothetical protein E6J91_32565 [Deltaproteobacteria bacterium]|nr:MAG: hypothetical protein E6J91_32565 [Deltaproteobacteria bacterium]